MILNKRLYFLILIFLLLSEVSVSQDLVPAEQIKNATWESKELSASVDWKFDHFDSLFNSKQSISVIDVDLSSGAYLSIVKVDTGFVATSTFGEEGDAIAAINGSYFDTKNSGSVTHFIYEKQLISTAKPSLVDYRGHAGVAIDKKGRAKIEAEPESGWESLKKPYTLLTSGPMLVYDGGVLSQRDEKFNTNRHPRTAIGITADNHLLAVTVDGRSSMAYGMTTPELAELMRALGCIAAMNLDGGGSTTMWVKGEGVVNYPSDNKEYDHGGERKVTNAILIMQPE